MQNVSRCKQSAVLWSKLDAIRETLIFDSKKISTPRTERFGKLCALFVQSETLTLCPHY